jgi:hypothetical protein
MAKTKTQPHAGPAATPGNGNGGSDVHFMPTQLPPANGFGSQSTAAPAATMAGMGDAAPTLSLSQGVLTGATAWNNSKQITALWSINQNRNSWVGIGGIGWKKLANNSDSAITALTMLSAHARTLGSTVHYRDESDGMIHEMYVW